MAVPTGFLARFEGDDHGGNLRGAAGRGVRVGLLLSHWNQRAQLAA